jgi:glycosyltransferase involved in cell wall biosynthesis
MADAVIELLDDPERRAGMGAAGSAIVQRDHAVEAAGPQLLDVVERVVGKAMH